MARPRKQDPEILQAALIGLKYTLGVLEQRIAGLRSQLAGKPASGTASTGAAPDSGGTKRSMSAAARHRIALAQKKRWAAYHAAKSKPAAAPKPHARVMSAEGRARIAAATKKRWAAFRKAQPAAKPASKKAKSAARKTPEAAAAPAGAASAPSAE